MDGLAFGSRLTSSLVHCDTMGVNAFFVRSDLAAPFAAAGHRRRLWRVGAFTAHPFGHHVRAERSPPWNQ